MSHDEPREVFFEMIRMGRYVRVSAIDAETGTEVQIVGDPAQGEAMMKRIALRKLTYVLRKRRESGGTPA